MSRAAEDGGDSVFALAWNDGSERNILLLTGLRKVISEQLPNMPRDYIIRVLFDRSHRCICILKNEKSNEVQGGICFRPFHSQGFAEIVFLAITESQKHKGFGTKVMNHLKEHVKTENIKYFLTYADNTAIGYFMKQGFTKRKTMIRARWEGYIKDYVRSTLMECKILYNVNYLTLKETLKMQREAVLKKISSLSKSHVVYPGIKESKFPMSLEDIPGVLDAGFDPQTYAPRAMENGSLLQLRCSQVIKIIKKMKQAWPFQLPVREEEAPGYYELIKKPMDLSSIDSKINSGLYKTKEEFIADFQLMCDNCRTFNPESSIYVKCANALEKKFKALIKRL